MKYRTVSPFRYLLERFREYKETIDSDEFDTQIQNILDNRNKIAIKYIYI